MAAYAHSPAHRRTLPAHPQNIGTTERWVSTALGLGLALTAARGSIVGRVVRGAAALTLLTRGATGFCAMRGALTGQTSFQDGMKEQWRRVSSGLTSRAASRIDNMEAMYVAELQELHSAEEQLCELAERLSPTLGDSPLHARLDGYATELRARKAELEGLLARCHADPRAHPDDAMQALAHETVKMAQMRAPMLREAALTASLQRIIHYKIAGYGAIAAYAKALGRVDEAGQLAGFADRDKAIDAELTDLAKSTLNPEATVAPHEEPAAGMRAH